MIKVGDTVYAKLVVRKIIQDAKGISYYLTDTKGDWEHMTLPESAVCLSGEGVLGGEEVCKS